MKKNSLLRTFIFLIFMSATPCLHAQEGNWTEPFDTVGHTNRWKQAAAAIQDLKDGVLVVRLRSDQRKIEALQGQLATPNLKEKYRTRLKKMLDDTRRENETENKSLVAAFREHFDFTDVLFMYDTATYLLKNGQKEGFFLNDSLQVDPHLSLQGRTFRLVRFGSKSGMKQRKSLIGMDLNFRDLPAPFPTSGNVSFWEGIVLIFKKDKNWKSDYHFHVSRFNDQLHKFYEKCRRKGVGSRE